MLALIALLTIPILEVSKSIKKLTGNESTPLSGERWKLRRRQVEPRPGVRRRPWNTRSSANHRPLHLRVELQHKHNEVRRGLLLLQRRRSEGAVRLPLGQRLSVATTVRASEAPPHPHPAPSSFDLYDEHHDLIGNCRNCTTHTLEEFRVCMADVRANMKFLVVHQWEHAIGEYLERIKEEQEECFATTLPPTTASPPTTPF